MFPSVRAKLTAVFLICAMISASFGGGDARAESAPAATSASSLSACPAIARHIDAARTGYSCSSITPPLHEKWSVSLAGHVSYPVIADGKVFVTTETGAGYGAWLYALDATTGTTAWGPIPLAGTYYYFPLTYGDGRVYVNNFDGTVRAFDAGSGAALWSRPTEYFSGEPVFAAGRVWVHGSSNVRGINATTGVVEVTSPSLDGSGSGIAVDNTGVAVSTGCRSQYRLDLAGAIVWQIHDNCSGGGNGPSHLSGGRMYGGDGNLVMDAASGNILRSYAGTPAFRGDVGYFAVGNAVYAQNEVTGAPLWTRSVMGSIVAGPVATDGAIFVATSTTLYVLDPHGTIVQTVALRSAFEADGQYSGTPADLAVGDDLVLVPTGNRLTAYEGLTAPGAPTILRNATRGNGQATVSWTVPTWDGGTPITGYAVTPYIGHYALSPVVFSSTATTQTITGLTNGTTYRFRVQAINAMGASAYSAVTNPVTPATVPGAPTIRPVTPGDGQATVSWTAPSSNGGSPITAYVVTPYVGFYPLPPTTFNSTATTQVVTGLTNGTTYRFRVRAINAVGTGAYSTASNPVTPTAG